MKYLVDENISKSDKFLKEHPNYKNVKYQISQAVEDQEIVEYVERLKAPFKVRNGTRKWLHRRACSKFLPSEVIHRKKRGFAVNVVDEWFRTSLSKRMNGLLLDEDSLVYDFLRPERVRKLLQDHRTGRSDNHKILFSLVVLEELLRSYSP